MKKICLISKKTVAIALLFAVNINADAQFGNLRGLANKAKKALKDKTEDVINGTASSATSSSSSSGSVESAVRKVAAGDPGELPWTMTREGQSKSMPSLRKAIWRISILQGSCRTSRTRWVF